MGSLQYGVAGPAIEFSDRALIHIQIVITGKLRRHESFLFSWTDSVELGSGRSSIWLDSSIPLFYRYLGSRMPSVNQAWLADLRRTADSGTGMLFTPEPPVGGDPEFEPVG
jgi:hypothetical protein